MRGRMGERKGVRTRSMINEAKTQHTIVRACMYPAFAERKGSRKNARIAGKLASRRDASLDESFRSTRPADLSISFVFSSRTSRRVYRAPVYTSPRELK